MPNRNKRNQRALSPRNSQTTSIAIETKQSFSGPLPHPQVLDQDATIVHGSAEKIITTIEKVKACLKKTC